MADIKKVDVDTYVRLLIAEKLGYERGVCSDSGLKKQTDTNERKLTRKQPSRLEDTHQAETDRLCQLAADYKIPIISKRS